MSNMKSVAQIIVTVKGRDWKFLLLTDRVFDKAHNSEDEGTIANTIEDKREVHFRKTDFTPKAVKHELAHVLHFESLVGSSELSPADSIELMCEIVGEHCEEIILWSNKITEYFLTHS